MRRADLTEAVRKTLERYPAPHDAHYGVVPAAPPTGLVNFKTVDGSHAVGMKTLLKADKIAAALPHHFALSRILVRQEAVNSSSMEGTHSTLDAVLEAEEAEDDSGTDAATAQVRDYALALERAMRLILEHGRNAFTVELIEDLHRTVMSGDPDYQDVAGEPRTKVVWVAGSSLGIEHSKFNPPPPRRLGRCLDDHIRYLCDDGMQQLQQSIILRLAVAHAHFEAIHPFRDGNGRVGRLLVPLMMAADGYPALYLAPFIALNKTRYIDGLIAAQQRLDYAPLVNFISDAIVSTVREAELSIEALRHLTAVWLRRKKFRAGSAAQRALDLLIGFPIVTARRLAEELRITYAAANKGIAQLVENEILSEHTGRQRNRIFVAREVRRIYNRAFGDEPDVPSE
jgi:Fic family protein